jgi:hypothetical protein
MQKCADVFIRFALFAMPAFISREGNTGPRPHGPHIRFVIFRATDETFDIHRAKVQGDPRV